MNPKNVISENAVIQKSAGVLRLIHSGIRKSAIFALGLIPLLPIFTCGGSFIVSCAPATSNTLRVNTIAIWQIENASSLSAQHLDLGELFSMQIAEVIKKTGAHRVVERERLVLALEELHLSTTSLVDESTRLKLGKLVGAHLMVFGTYQVFSEMMRIDLRLVDVETGKILKAVSRSTPDPDMDLWLKAIQDAASDLL